MNTETIDKLFLELSHVTKASTNKELSYKSVLWECYHVFRGLHEGDLKVEHVAVTYKNKIYDVLQKYK